MPYVSAGDRLRLVAVATSLIFLFTFASITVFSAFNPQIVLINTPLSTLLSQEIANRISNDTFLQSQLSSDAASLQAQLAAETSARVGNDTSLLNLITIETINRISNDTALALNDTMQQNEIDELIIIVLGANGTFGPSPCNTTTLCGLQTQVNLIAATYVTLGTVQTITASKTLAAVGPLVLQPGGTGFTTTIASVTPSIGNVTVTIPNPLISTVFILGFATTTQTINTQLSLNAASGQLILNPGSGGNAWTIQAPNSRGQATTFTIQDPGTAAANIITSQGAQSLAGVVSFTNTASSTTSALGTIVVSGGAGFGSGGAVDATNQNNGGTLTVSGGGAFSLSLWVGTTLNIVSTSNQIALGVTHTITLSAPTPAASVTYTIADMGGPSTFLMTALASGQQTASSNFLFSGVITFYSSTAMAFTALNPLFTFGPSNHLLTISVPEISLASQTYTIPDVQTSANFLMSASASGQTASSAFTFSSPLTLSATTDQIVFGAPGATTTLNVAAPSSSLIVSLAAPGTGGSNIVLTNAANLQTITTAVAFSSVVTFTSATTSSSDTTGGIVVTGGVGIEGNGAVDATSSTDGGALTVAGGAAISKSLWIGTTLNIVSTSNQMTFGSSAHLITVDFVSPVEPQTYTVPDTAGSSSFIMSQTVGGQSVAGPFSFSGVVLFTSGTTSSSDTTGGIVVTGGVGIEGNGAQDASSATNGGSLTVAGGGAFAKSVWIGTTINVAGIASFTSATTSSSSSTGGAVFVGGVGIEGNGAQDASSSTNGGALTVAGGGAFSKSLWVGTTFHVAGIATFSSATTSTSSSTGGAVFVGGVGIEGNSAVDATSSTDGGALTVAGGGAFSKSLWVGTTLNLVGGSNQMVIQPGGTGDTFTFTAATPLQNTVITWPDPGQTTATVALEKASSSGSFQFDQACGTPGSTTVKWDRVQNSVTLTIEAFTCTSTSASWLISTTGLPAIIQPARTVFLALGAVQTAAGPTNSVGTLEIITGTGIMWIGPNGFSTFAGSGTIGLAQDISVSYLVV